MPEKPTEFDAAEYIETVEDARQHLSCAGSRTPVTAAPFARHSTPSPGRRI